MTLHEFESENLPETLSMEQIRIICHISKLTARFYVKSGLLKNTNSGKKTRCYSVSREDFLQFIEEYKQDPIRFQPPPEWYRENGKTSPKRWRKPVLGHAETYCKHLYYTNLLQTYPDLLTIEHLTQITGYSRTALQKWIRCDKIKALMTTPKILVPKRHLLDFLISEFCERISVKSPTHIEHLNRIYREYAELKNEKENEDEN